MGITRNATAIPGYRRVNDLDSPTRAEIDKPKHARAQSQRVEAFDLAHRLALRVHELVERFPDNVRPDFAQRLFATAISIAVKLMEDPATCDRGTYQDSLRGAHSKTTEISYQLLLSRDLGHITAIQYSRLRTDYLRLTQIVLRLIHDR